MEEILALCGRWRGEQWPLNPPKQRRRHHNIHSNGHSQVNYRHAQTKHISLEPLASCALEPICRCCCCRCRRVKHTIIGHKNQRQLDKHNSQTTLCDIVISWHVVEPNRTKQNQREHQLIKNAESASKVSEGRSAATVKTQFPGTNRHYRTQSTRNFVGRPQGRRKNASLPLYGAGRARK